MRWRTSPKRYINCAKLSLGSAMPFQIEPIFLISYPDPSGHSELLRLVHLPGLENRLPGQLVSLRFRHIRLFEKNPADRMELVERAARGVG